MPSFRTDARNIAILRPLIKYIRKEAARAPYGRLDKFSSIMFAPTDNGIILAAICWWGAVVIHDPNGKANGYGRVVLPKGALKACSKPKQFRLFDDNCRPYLEDAPACMTPEKFCLFGPGLYVRSKEESEEYNGILFSCAARLSSENPQDGSAVIFQEDGMPDLLNQLIQKINGPVEESSPVSMTAEANQVISDTITAHEKEKAPYGSWLFQRANALTAPCVVARHSDDKNILIISTEAEFRGPYHEPYDLPRQMPLPEWWLAMKQK